MRHLFIDKAIITPFKLDYRLVEHISYLKNYNKSIFSVKADNYQKAWLNDKYYNNFQVWRLQAKGTQTGRQVSYCIAPAAPFLKFYRLAFWG